MKEIKKLTDEEKATLAKKEYMRQYRKKYKEQKKDVQLWAKKYDEMFSEGAD